MGGQVPVFGATKGTSQAGLGRRFEEVRTDSEPHEEGQNKLPGRPRE